MARTYLRVHTFMASHVCKQSAIANIGDPPVSFSLQFNGMFAIGMSDTRYSKSTGTAIYVYFVLANQPTEAGTPTLTNVSFTLDGHAESPFTHNPNLASSDYDYSTLVFSKASLENAQHSLVATAEATDTSSLILFDYAKYMCVSFECGRPISESKIHLTGCRTTQIRLIAGWHIIIESKYGSIKNLSFLPFSPINGLHGHRSFTSSIRVNPERLCSREHPGSWFAS